MYTHRLTSPFKFSSCLQRCVGGLLLMSCLVVLAACWGNDAQPDAGENNQVPDEQTEAGTERGEPAYGGTLDIGLFSFPEHVHPVFSTSADHVQLEDLVFESLVRLNDDLEWEPWLAERWEIDDDGGTVVLHLREGVRWHDGQTFSADDVRFTYEVLADPDYSGLYQPYVRYLEGFDSFQAGGSETLTGVEVIDEHTVALHFREGEMSDLAIASIKIMPAHVFEGYSVTDMADPSRQQAFDEMIGTGPFEPVSYAAHQYYEWQRNEQYWQGSPYIEMINGVLVNQDVAFRLLQSGDLDVVMPPEAGELNALDLYRDREGIHVWRQPTFTVYYLGFKLAYRPEEDVQSGAVIPDRFDAHSILAEREFREAIMLAIDEEGLEEQLSNDLLRVVSAPAPHHEWFNNHHRFDPEQAQAILDELDYAETDGDGYRQSEEGTLQLQLVYDESQPFFQQLAEAVADDLETAGIAVDVLGLPSNEYYDRLLRDERSVDMFVGTIQIRPDDPDMLQTWYADHIWNFTRWSDQENEDHLARIQEARQSPFGEWKERYEDWADHLLEEIPYVFLLHQDRFLVYHDRLRNVREHPVYFADNIHEWYFQAEEDEQIEPDA